MPLSGPDIVATAYRYARPRTDPEANRTGSFYTPPWLARAVVAAVLTPRLERRSSAAISRLRILDPSCGSGVFLLAAIESLRERLTALGEPGKLAAISAHILHGIDRDPTAIATAGALLSEATSAPSGPVAERWPQLICADALLTPTEALFGSRGQFDIIIGNPPYGLSRDNQISAAENAALKRIFAGTRAGRINKYLAFIARSFELLAENGTLALIVPNAWLAIKEGTRIRELLLDHAALRELVVLPPRTFPGLGVETVLLVADKGLRHTRVRIQPNGFAPHWTPTYLTYSVCRAQPGAAIPITWTPAVTAVWEELRTCPPLRTSSSRFTPRIALQAYAAGKGTPPQTAHDVASHPFHSNEPSGEGWHPYLEGRDVQRYHLSWSGAYLRHGPWLAEPQPLERFTGPRLVLREILAPPPYSVVATYTDATYLYNKSILHITDADPTALHALLVILNSRLGTFVMRTRGRKGARGLFPKIVADDLKAFPLPHRFEDFIGTLAHLMPSSAASRLTAERNAELDAAVYAAYGLSPHARATIEQLTRHDTRSTRRPG